MSDPFENGGAAFPLHLEASRDYGMSLRDYFAGKAMARIIGDERFVLGYDPEQVADRAYEYADAMLKARQPSTQANGRTK